MRELFDNLCEVTMDAINEISFHQNGYINAKKFSEISSQIITFVALHISIYQKEGVFAKDLDSTIDYFNSEIRKETLRICGDYYKK